MISFSSRNYPRFIILQAVVAHSRRNVGGQEQCQRHKKEETGDLAVLEPCHDLFPGPNT